MLRFRHPSPAKTFPFLPKRGGRGVSSEHNSNRTHHPNPLLLRRERGFLMQRFLTSVASKNLPLSSQERGPGGEFRTKLLSKSSPKRSFLLKGRGLLNAPILTSVAGKNLPLSSKERGPWGEFKTQFQSNSSPKPPSLDKRRGLFDAAIPTSVASKNLPLSSQERGPGGEFRVKHANPLHALPKIRGRGAKSNKTIFLETLIDFFGTSSNFSPQLAVFSCKHRIRDGNQRDRIAAKLHLVHPMTFLSKIDHEDG